MHDIASVMQDTATLREVLWRLASAGAQSPALAAYVGTVLDGAARDIDTFERVIELTSNTRSGGM